MVAKSYQSLKQTCEPFSKNGRMYVNVLTTTGLAKTVRWYTEAEYKRMYPGDQIPEKVLNQKHMLGFDEGYITIFKGIKDESWFEKSSARYARWWGWYFVSTDKVPEDLPEGIKAVRLPWSKVGLENKALKPGEEVAKIVKEILKEA